jgi:hypothetical protein
MGQPSEDTATDAAVKALAAAYPDVEERAVRDKVDATITRARRMSQLDDASIDDLLRTWTAQLPARRPALSSLEVAVSDLRRWLGPADGGLTKQVQAAIAFALDHYVPLTSVLAVLATAFYASAYGVFYERLDISPKEAGVSTPELLTRSAVGGIVMLLLVSAGIFLLLAPYLPRMEAVEGAQRRRGTLGQLLGVFGLALLLPAALALQGGVFDLGLGALAVGYSVVFVIGPLLAAVRASLPGRGRPLLEIRPLEFDGRVFAGSYFALMPTALVLVLAFTTLTAVEKGDDARDGKAVPSPEILGVPFLGVRAEPAFVTWVDPKPQRALALPACVLYLGTADGKALLYDAATRRTVHAPATDIVLSTRRERSSCDAPVNQIPPEIRKVRANVYRCWPGKWRSGARTPTLAYEWTDRYFRDTLSKSREIVVGDDRPPFANEVVQCRVEASTSLGRDVAHSAPVLVTTGAPAHVGLSLEYEQGIDSRGRACALDGPVQARVVGADVIHVRRVAFSFGRARAQIDREPPFERPVDRHRHRGDSHEHLVLAHLVIEDREPLNLRKRLRFCGGDG